MNLSAKSKWEGPDCTWAGEAKGKSLALLTGHMALRSEMVTVPRGSAAWQHGVSEGKCLHRGGRAPQGRSSRTWNWGPCHHNFLYIQYQCLSQTDSKCSFLRNHTKIRAKQVQLGRVSSFLGYCSKKQRVCMLRQPPLTELVTLAGRSGQRQPKSSLSLLSQQGCTSLALAQHKGAHLERQQEAHRGYLETHTLQASGSKERSNQRRTLPAAMQHSVWMCVDVANLAGVVGQRSVLKGPPGDPPFLFQKALHSLTVL